MKIYIENLKPNMSPYNGKGKFIQRLAKQFRKDGHTILDFPDGCDINFRMNALPSTGYGKSVVRLDNIRYSNEALHVKNDANDMTRVVMNQADGIVFQSEISERLCIGVLQAVPKRSAVIYNGVDPDEFRPEKRWLPNKSYLIAFQILHPMRRLNQIFNIWYDFIDKHEKSFLYVLYDKTMTGIDVPQSKWVFPSNAVEQDSLSRTMTSCDAVINMTYMDSCPNMVIEALACGTHSIIGESNGISHILDRYRVQDAPVVASMQDWTEPPAFDEQSFYDRLCEVYNNPKPKVDFPAEFHIKNTAKQYIDFFQRILND